MKPTLSTILASLGLVVIAQSATAAELSYRPTNPAFGGSPLTGTYHLEIARAQGKGAKKDEQQFPEINMPDLGNTGGGQPIIIIGGGTTPTNP